MPIDLTIPTMVDIYILIIEKLSKLSSEHDSISEEAKILKIEIQYYLKLIREEMDVLAKEYKGDLED